MQLMKVANPVTVKWRVINLLFVWFVVNCCFVVVDSIGDYFSSFNRGVLTFPL